MTFEFAPILAQWPYLLGGAGLSLTLAVLVFVFGTLIGLLCASLQRYGAAPLRRLVAGYVMFATNTPQLVQILFLFFVLPSIGVTLSPFTAVLTGATFNAGAYLCEIQRAGFASVRREEIEAAKSLGFSTAQIVRHVIFPHVLKVSFAPLSNQFIVIVLGTSMASLFGVEELTGRTSNLSSQTYLSVEAYIVAAVAYVLMTLFATWALALFVRYVRRAPLRLR